MLCSGSKLVFSSGVATSTFLMFVEYARNAVRMAALMKQRQVMVYNHLPEIYGPR
jgi:transketolase